MATTKTGDEPRADKHAAAADGPGKNDARKAADRRKIEASLGKPLKLYDPHKRKLQQEAAAAAARAPGDRIFAAKAGGMIQTFIGEAANAKSGAVVDTGSGVYYLEGIPEWPGDVLGKRVKVAGIVQRKKLAPDPTVGPNGEQSTAMVGSSSVIVAPKWKLFPAP